MIRQRRANRASIVALGDSTTAGTPLFKSPIEAPPDGSGDERSQFAYWLMRQHPDWTVLNRGVNGERTRSDRRALRSRRARPQPAAVIIIAGVNDVYQGRDVEHVTTHLRDDVRPRQSRQASRSSPEPSFRTTPRQPSRTARCGRSTHWIAAQPAKDPNMVVVDTRAAAAASNDRDKLSGSPDGLHPDINGYRKMAEALEPVLRRVLEKR